MRAIACLFALAVVTTAGNAISADYSVINLGSLGGSTRYTYAYDINNSGQITGYSMQPAANSYGGNIYSYIWNPETRSMTTPGSIGGGSLEYNGWNRGYGINRSGTIAGYYYHYGGEMPFTYSTTDGVVRDILIRNGSEYYWYAGKAYDINDAGTVLGVVSKQQGYPYTDAFIYGADGSFTTLGFGDVTEAGGINNSGTAVGSSWMNGGMNGWVYQGGEVEWLGGLGEDPYLRSSAIDINDNGLVTGGAQLWYDATPGNPYDLDYRKTFHAFIWDEDHGMIDLGSLIGIAGSSSGTGINSQGHVVGMSSSSNWGNQHAFLWEEGVMHDLNNFLPDDSGWLLEEAYAINDRGEIVGVGTYNGERAAYLLTPVPEPSTLALMAAGLAGSILLRRRSRK